MASIKYLSASNGIGEAAKATVSTARSIGATTLIVDSVSNFPAYFIATSGVLNDETGYFDPATMVVFLGHLSGANIIIDSFAPGYADIGNAALDIVVLKPTTKWVDELVAAFLVAHNDDGTLNVAKTTNPYKAFVYLSTDQLNLTNNAWTKVLLDVEYYDTNNNFAAYKYTVPVSGVYSVKAMGVFTTTAVDTAYDLAIYVDGSITNLNSIVIPTAVSAYVNLVTNLLLTAGQYVELYVRSHSGANTADLTSGGLYTKMIIELISL